MAKKKRDREDKSVAEETIVDNATVEPVAETVDKGTKEKEPEARTGHKQRVEITKPIEPKDSPQSWAVGITFKDKAQTSSRFAKSRNEGETQISLVASEVVPEGMYAMDSPMIVVNAEGVPVDELEGPMCKTVRAKSEMTGITYPEVNLDKGGIPKPDKAYIETALRDAFEWAKKKGIVYIRSLVISGPVGGEGRLVLRGAPLLKKTA